MARKRRRKGSGAAIWVAGVALLLACVAIVVGFTYLKFTNSTVELGSDLCPTDGPSSRVAVLVDVSDPLPSVGRKQVLAKLTDLALNGKKYERVDIYTFGSNDVSTHLLFSGCNPGRGTNASQLTSNPKLIEKQFLDSFQTPVLSALDKIPQRTADSSPIMSSLQQWAIESLTKNADKKYPTKLILISDMIENTKYYSQYKSGTAFDEFRKSTASDLFETNFHNIDVEIWYVKRLGTKIDEFKHAMFWNQWFKSNRAGNVTIKKIQIGSL